jgi:hypothetical protein
MTYDQLISVIYGSSKSDWLLSDERGIYTHKSNLNIRIERKEIDQDFDKFSRKGWTTTLIQLPTELSMACSTAPRS